MLSRKLRIAALEETLLHRVVVIDGAMGTSIQQLQLSAQDYGAASLEGCNEHLLLTKPEVIRSIHAGYMEAGADILKTNSFNATPLVMNEYGLSEKAEQLNFLSARLAREVADSFSTSNHPRWVAGSMGPTTKAISVTGGITFNELIENYYLQAKGLWEGGVDYLLLETCHDTVNIKAGYFAIQRLCKELNENIPLAISGTFESTGTMLAGQSVEAFCVSLEHLHLLYLGINCATGPAHMHNPLRILSRTARTRVACAPNAGLPDAQGRYLETPEMFTRAVSEFAQAGWLNLVGGCCGTQRDHIAAVVRAARQWSPRQIPVKRRSVLAGIDVLEIKDQNRPYIVGERANVMGSKKFRDLIAQEKWDEASDIARSQIKQGASIIDISCQQADRNEVNDLRCLLEKVTRKVRVPLMIDSTNETAIAEGLSWCQGKAIINSVNLEDGEKRLQGIVPLALQFGAALVVGCIDEKGQAITFERKLEIALRSHKLLTEKYGMAEEDLYFDPLVFPCASGDENYIGSPNQTIKAVAAIRQTLPRCRTVLGISNVSFGLPAAGREVINSVFLHYCVQAGLDLAIVNAEKCLAFSAISESDRVLAENVLFGRGQGSTPAEKLGSAIAEFANQFREKRVYAAPLTTLPVEERLARHILEGSKEGLADDLKEQLTSLDPLDIVNGPLMKGMEEVGRLFNEGKLIVAEVLQSAEAMKTAVTLLEPYLSSSEAATRGKILLATVKGDVHDIGKNLVEIVLSNNGFKVVDLGTKVDSETIIKAAKEHDPDIIGLSGLLVKSALQMVTTANDLQQAGIETPIVVGGAALSQNFVDHNISPAYNGVVAFAADAMSGLNLARQLTDSEKSVEIRLDNQRKRQKFFAAAHSQLQKSPSQTRSTKVTVLDVLPPMPDGEQHILSQTPLDALWELINPSMLYGRHLGLKSSLARSLIHNNSNDLLMQSEAGRKALWLRERVESVKKECRHGFMTAQAIFRFFNAHSQGNSVHLFASENDQRPLVTFEFPRQLQDNGLCLSDYISPRPKEDSICLFIATAGKGIAELAKKYRSQGEYLQSHILQALALETAEGYAEYLHSMVRRMWGIGENQGKRYSFGYASCPRLEDQRLLFDLLKPEEIGIELTESLMMSPEASVSGLVFHHPQASHFSVLS